MGVEHGSVSMCYEEIRKQRVEDNKKRMLDLGLRNLSKTLSEAVSSVSKTSVSKTERQVKPRTLEQEEPLERRRSSRVAGLPIPVYREVDDFPRYRKSVGSRSSKRFLHAGKCASYEERMQAKRNAEKIQKHLVSGHPSFVKPMLRSHVSSCFWLGLPTSFCREHLPKRDETMVLEDEKGEECDTIYIASRTGLSGGWRGFSLDHKLDDGDALVFELVEPTRFKVTTRVTL
eukprot:Gb_07025 [translate_table: standard]